MPRRRSLSGVTGVFCVTLSVAVGTRRDGQDTTGQNSIIEAYLAPRADSTKEFANSTNRPIRFSRPPPSTTRPSLPPSQAYIIVLASAWLAKAPKARRRRVKPEFASSFRITSPATRLCPESVPIGTNQDATRHFTR
jgi:hypothetical protein